MNVLCFDIGGTYVKYAIFKDGKIKEFPKFKNRIALSFDLFVNDVIGRISDVQKNCQLNGISISTAGMIDYKDYSIEFANERMPGYTGFNWPKIIKDEFNIKAYIENDVKSMCLGEKYFGAGKKFSSIFCMAIGTGIGGAAFINGDLYRGTSGNACEIGYMPIGEHKYEDLASTSSILNYGNRKFKNLNVKNGIELFDLYDKGDERAEYLVNYMADVNARAISNIILLIDPEAVIVGGGIAEQETLIDLINENLEKYLPLNIYQSSKVLKAELGNRAALFGAYKNFLNEENR